jgi:HTH-type transcriptional regulator / antitoxin HigA
MDKHVPAEVFPPGEFLRDELEARGWTQSELATIMGRPVQTINAIIGGRKKITPETAQGLADALGTTAAFWLNLESAYRLSLVRAKHAEVSRRAKLYAMYPVTEMVRRGWIKKSDSAKALENELKRFFEKDSVDEPPDVPFAARAARDYNPAQRAWLFRAARLARGVNAARFDRATFTSQGLPALQQLVASEHDVRRIPRLLAELGVRLVIVERVKGSHIDGATIWPNDATPVIALSIRYDRIDNFWFTLAHEAMHVKHGDRSVDVDLVGEKPQPTAEKDEFEQRADREATAFLIDPLAMERFCLRMQGQFSRAEINRFANRIQVHPGIIAGQLHHRFATHSYFREMLAPVRDAIIEAALSDGWGVCPPI